MSSQYNKALLGCLIHWDNEQLFFHADEYFGTLLNEIDNARNTIDIECYIFDQDNIGRRVINALSDAASRGINVRVIIDGVGSLSWSKSDIDELSNLGIETKIFNPLPWKLSLYQAVNLSKGYLSKFIFLLSKINKRDHRKLYIFDKKKAMSGSINLSTVHTSLCSGEKNWLDCGVLVTGAPVSELSHSFNEVFKNFPESYAIGNRCSPFRTNNNIVKRQRKNFEFIRLIRSSKKRIWITNAYIAPSKRIVRALKEAKRDGVDVKLLISQQSDVIFFPLVSSVYYQELINAGIQIFEHNQKIIHAKTVLFDDLALVGSTNLNHRSFLHDLELDIILTAYESLNSLKKEFTKLILKSRPISASSFENKVWYKKMTGKLFWRFRYWL